MALNLAMHVWPKTEPGTWMRAVDAVRARWHLFDGRKLIAVAKSADADSPQCVMDMFPEDAEFIEVDNDDSVRELASFVPLLEHSLRPGDRTFYCHAKGCTHETSNLAPHMWTDMMFHACLDYPGLVELALDKFPLAGCFRRRGRFKLEPDNWHYSGSFFWLDADKVTAKEDWRETDAIKWGNEAWPGRHWGWRDTATLFFDNVFHLYTLAYWEVVKGHFVKWRQALDSIGLGARPDLEEHAAPWIKKLERLPPRRKVKTEIVMSMPYLMRYVQC